MPSSCKTYTVHFISFFNWCFEYKFLYCLVIIDLLGLLYLTRWWQAHTVLEMNYTEQQLTAAVVSEGLRPVLATPESSASTKLTSLIQKCWDADPQKRPSFNGIVSELDLMLGCKKVVNEQDAFVNSRMSCGHTHETTVKSYQEPINWLTHGKVFSPSDLFTSQNVLGTWFHSSNDSSAYHPVLSWGSFSAFGRGETMEVALFLIPNFCNEKDIHFFFGIFYGHRGGEVKWQLDTWRVGLAALQVTRSIGDDDLKPYVTAEPEVDETLLSG
ncbi:protein kinase and PP2C-like domain-containing protein isoform X2 [Primulina huaijiensis]|uniref:protein kinase and PP2C-like domain-containing protein isoform X2 n=1 Tax=Primulina huaijiensis TaxID=1492673 RepID=UPI003CC78D40